MTPLRKYLSVAYLPGLVAAVFVWVKLFNIDWPVDLEGMSAVLGAVFLATGAVTCFLMQYVRLQLQPHSGRTTQFWVLGSLLFTLLFYDAAFGIHEYMWVLDLPEFSFFLVEAALLAVLILPYLFTLDRWSFGLLFAFGLLASAAILGDSSSAHEGLFTLSGTTYSYEQSAETVGVFCLMGAFFRMATVDLAAWINRT